MKRADLLIPVLTLLIAAGLWLWLFSGRETGSTAVVAVDGEVIGRYALDEPRTVEIGDGNRLVIADGAVGMDWADCRDQYCVHQRAISLTGETIACVPNRVVISISGDEPESGLDAVAG